MKKFRETHAVEVDGETYEIHASGKFYMHTNAGARLVTSDPRDPQAQRILAKFYERDPWWIRAWAFVRSALRELPKI